MFDNKGGNPHKNRRKSSKASAGETVRDISSSEDDSPHRRNCYKSKNSVDTQKSVKSKKAQKKKQGGAFDTSDPALQSLWGQFLMNQQIQ